MQYSKKVVSKFEVGLSSNWLVHFTDQSLNIVGKNFPAISVKFGLFEPTNTEIEVAPNFRIKVPVSSKGASTVDIEFYDDDNRTIQSILYKKVTSSPMHKKGRSFININNVNGSIKSGAIEITVEEYSKTHKLVKTHIMSVWPAAPLEMMGDQEFKAIQKSISFDVLSYDQK